MNRITALAFAVYLTAVTAGTLADAPPVSAPASLRVLAGDFHVHAAPGDGMLPVWEAQREAERRGLDVIAITNHNHDYASRLGQRLGLTSAYPIVIASQELTTPDFHIAAVGVTTMVDWRLPGREAIAAIHRQGGVAIAAHPILNSWRERDEQALRMLDGVEVAHPIVRSKPERKREVEEFFARVRQLRPEVSPIGSSDFHGGPLGDWRTYLIVDEVSREGVLDAIRRGRTVAAGPDGRLIGGEEHVALVRRQMSAAIASGFGYGLSTWLALAALLALGVIVTRGGTSGP